MAPRRHPQAAESPQHPRAGPNPLQEAGRKAPAGSPSTPRSKTHLAGDSPSAAAKGPRHPRRVRRDVTVPADAETDNDGLANQEFVEEVGGAGSAPGVSADDGLATQEFVGEVGGAGSAPGVSVDDGLATQEFIGEVGGVGNEPGVNAGDGFEGADCAPGGDADGAGGARGHLASGPSAVAGLGVDFGHAALFTPSLVGGRPGAFFLEKALVQAAPTLESAYAPQQVAAPRLHVNTRARRAHRGIAYPQRPEPGVTTALEAARSTGTASGSKATRSGAGSCSLSERDLDQTSLDGIPGNCDVPPEMALLAARVGQRMRESFGGFAISSANVVRSYANSLPKLVAISACVRSMSPLAVRNITWLMLSPGNKDVGCERHLRECGVDGKDVCSALVDYLSLVYTLWKAKGSTRLGHVG